MNFKIGQKVLYAYTNPRSKATMDVPASIVKLVKNRAMITMHTGGTNKPVWVDVSELKAIE